MIYVLIAIVLFAALSMTLGRQTDTNEASALDDSKTEMYATQFIAYAASAKSAIEQMEFSGTDVANIDFTLPSQAGFNNAPTITKIYHPDGGGLNPGKLPEDVVTDNVADPVAGWYMGRFNNVEWTDTTAQDVILTAFQINQSVCAKLNETITGSSTIPQLGDTIRETLIDDSFYMGATNVDLTTDPAGTPICADCHNRAALCVEDSAGGTYAFYTVISPQ